MPNIFEKLLMSLFVIVGLLANVSLKAAESNYPSRPVRIIVPFPAGGATDVITRLLAQELSDKWSQSVIVENRPGAATIIATGQAAKSTPDGYTLLVVTAAFTVNPSLHKNLPFNTVGDFEPITLVSAAPNILVVNSSLPVSSVSDLIAYAKENPGKVNFASAGNGTSNHLAGEMFKSMAGVDIVHVPYKGDMPAITDLIGGQVQMLFVGLASIGDHIHSKRLKALAVSTSKPSKLLPKLTTVASTLSGFDSSAWNGIVAPTGVPEEIVTLLQRDIAEVLAGKNMKARINELGFDVIGNTPAEFQDYLAKDIKKSADLITKVGIKAN